MMTKKRGGWLHPRPARGALLRDVFDHFAEVNSLAPRNECLFRPGLEVFRDGSAFETKLLRVRGRSERAVRTGAVASGVDIPVTATIEIADLQLSHVVTATLKAPDADG